MLGSVTGGLTGSAGGVGATSTGGTVGGDVGATLTGGTVEDGAGELVVGGGAVGETATGS